MNIFDLTPHQLDVLRTLAACIGGVGGFLGGIFAPFAWFARKWAKQAAHQTATSQWVNGALKTRSVAETSQDMLLRAEEFRGEITHLVNEPRIHGRRRLPTTEIPIGESTYE